MIAFTNLAARQIRRVFPSSVRVTLLGGTLALCVPMPVRPFERTARTVPGVETLQPDTTVTAFVDVTVIPMDRERLLPHQTVLVRGGRITALGPVARMRVPTGALRVDGQGKYLIPGLADMHLHLGTADSAQDERTLFLMLANGVTTVRNVTYSPRPQARKLPYADQLRDYAFILRLRARAAAGTLPSPRIYTAGPWGPEPYISALPERPPRLDSVASYVAAYKAAGYDFVKLHDEKAVTAESVAVAARRVGIPIMGHAEIVGLPEALRIGYASIEHMQAINNELWRKHQQGSDTVAVLDTSRIPTMVAAIKRAGAYVCPTFELNLLYTNASVMSDTAGRWPEVRYIPRGGVMVTPEIEGIGTSSLAETQATWFEVLRALQGAGVGLLSGTDVSDEVNAFPLYVPGFSLHRELAALVRAGLTPYQALATSTRNVAAYFGTLRESGTVAVGKRADLLLLDGNPLADIRETTRIAGVVRDGRWWPRAVLAPRVDTVLKAWSMAR